MNRNDELLNQALKTEQAGCRKDGTQCCGKCKKPTYEQLEAQVKQLAAENAALKSWAENRAKSDDALEQELYSTLKIDYRQRMLSNIQTPATDAYAASLRAEARKQGAVFAANRMLAAWDAGFVEDTPENAADIARAILMSTEFMDEAPDGDFDRSFADEVLEAIAVQLRSKSAISSADDEIDIEPFGFVRRSGDLVIIDVNGDPHIKDGMPVFVRSKSEVQS